MATAPINPSFIVPNAGFVQYTSQNVQQQTNNLSSDNYFEILTILSSNPLAYDQQTVIHLFCSILGHDHQQMIIDCVRSNEIRPLIYASRLCLQGETEEWMLLSSLLYQTYQYGHFHPQNLQIINAFLECLTFYSKHPQVGVYYRILESKFLGLDTRFLLYCSSDNKLFMTWLDFCRNQHFFELFENSPLDHHLKEQFLLSPLSGVVDDHISVGAWYSLLNNPGTLRMALEICSDKDIALKFMIYFDCYPSSIWHLAECLLRIPQSMPLFRHFHARDEKDIVFLTRFIEEHAHYQVTYKALDELLELCPACITPLGMLVDWEITMHDFTISSLFKSSYLAAPYFGDLIRRVYALQGTDKYLNELRAWKNVSPDDFGLLAQSFKDVGDHWLLAYLKNVSFLLNSDRPTLRRCLELYERNPRYLLILGVIGGLGLECAQPNVSRLQEICQWLEDPSLPSENICHFLIQFIDFPRVLTSGGVGDHLWECVRTDVLYLARIFREVPYPYEITCWHLLDLVPGENFQRNYASVLKKSFTNIYDPSKSLKVFLQNSSSMSIRFKRQLNEIIRQGGMGRGEQIFNAWFMSPAADRPKLERIVAQCVENNLVGCLPLLLREFTCNPHSVYFDVLVRNISKEAPNVLFAIENVKVDADKGLVLSKEFLDFILSFNKEELLPYTVEMLLYLYAKKEIGLFIKFFSIVKTDINYLNYKERYIRQALSKADIVLATTCLCNNQLDSILDHNPTLSYSMVKSLYRLSALPHCSLEDVCQDLELQFFCPSDKDLRILNAYNDQIHKHKASSRCLEADFNCSMITITRLIASAVVVTSGVIDIGKLSYIANSELLRDSFDSHSFDSVLSQIKRLLDNSKLRLVMEDLTLQGWQNGPMALLIRATLGLGRNSPIYDKDLITVVLMAYLYYDRQPAQAGSCVGVSRLAALLKSDPISICEIIQQLCIDGYGTHRNGEKCYLGLMPLPKFLDTGFTYHVASGLTTGIQQSWRSFFDLPYLTTLAAYFHINPLDISQFSLEVITWIVNSSRVDQQGNIYVKHRQLTEALAMYIPKYSPLKDVLPPYPALLKEVQFIYLSHTQPLLTRSLQGLFISMDSFGIMAAKKAIKNSLHQAVAKVYGIDLRSTSPKKILGAKIYEVLAGCVDKRLVQIYDYSYYPTSKSVLMDIDEANQLDYSALDTPDKVIDFLLHWTGRHVDGFMQGFLQSGVFSPNVMDDWQDLKNKLLNEIKSSSFINSIVSEFRREEYEVFGTASHAPWNLIPGARSIETVKATSREEDILLRTFQSHSAEDMIVFLKEYLETFDVYNPLNAKRSGRIPGHALTLQFDHYSLGDLLSTPLDIEYSLKSEFINKSKAISHGLIISEEHYNTLCKNMELYLPFEAKEKWRKLSAIPRSNTDLWHTRQTIYQNLLQVFGSDADSHNAEIALDTLLCKIIKSSENYENDIYFLRFMDLNWLNVEEEQAVNLAVWYSPMTKEWELWSTLHDGSDPQKIHKKRYFKRGVWENFLVFK